MAAAELPTTLVSSVTRTLHGAVGVTRSPFTGTSQVQDWGGSWWQYDIEFTVMSGPTARALAGFFASLRGPADTFIFRDPFIKNQVGLGTPLVNGASQTGNSLATDGWTGGGLDAGDFFSIGTGAAIQFYQLTADAPPTAGAATLQFTPALRSSPADNAALNVTNPGVLLRPTAPIPAQIGLADIHRFSISATEAI